MTNQVTDFTEVPATDDPRQRARRARFGTFEIDLKSGELRRGGVRIAIQDQPLRLLTFLLEHAGEVVTREELRERLWPAEFVDFDHSLNTAIRKLRTALDDSADHPRFVETLARRGYRFIAPVSWTRDANAVAVADPVPAASHPAAVPRNRAVWGVLAAALVVAGLAAAWWWRRGTTAAPVSAVAVLPFTSSDPKNEHLSDGVTEILIDRLSRLRDLRVMARSTVFAYKKKNALPARVGAELGVGAVVSGDIRTEGGRYTIHVELIDVRDGAQIWGQSYESTASDMPLAQRRIGDDLADQLRQDVTPEERRLASRGTTANAEAYEHYLRGLHLWNERGAANIRASVGHFQRAVELDPTFAAAWAGQANAYGVMVGMGQLTPAEGTVRIMACARKALDLDPDSAEAYTSMATTAFRNLWDFPGAERDYRKAISLNPNYATAHEWYGVYLTAMGRQEEGWREIETALRLDPLGPANSTMCIGLGVQRRYREALAFADRAEKLGRPLHQCRMSTLLAMRDFDALARELEADPSTTERREMLAGFRAGGERGLLNARLQALLHVKHVNAVEVAEAYAMLGDDGEAFTWLQRGFEQRLSRMSSFPQSPFFDSIRDDPRFIDLAHRVGLPQASLDAANPRSAAQRAAGVALAR